MKISHLKIFVAATAFLPVIASAAICAGPSGTLVVCAKPPLIGTETKPLVDICIYPGDCENYHVEVPVPKDADFGGVCTGKYNCEP